MSKPETSSKRRVNLKELAIRTLQNFLLQYFFVLDSGYILQFKQEYQVNRF